ncbi:glycosyltransferase [Reichenbachiella carrageenanivorans]|uniref:Glycosyltransferase n=1 Tax=Reichenbachiella carrageenanivorans TaxID=2979869 RepID=A0ABY6CVW8_9BACT|nr:glycosyltransferase family 2 protein [Reichenbachiella carrageenanivorans]UXX78061.1 glycosyltransferase [Reichenbachiella carrageenanivorans]
MMNLSVILPYYNAAHTLKEATQSILNQTYSDFELLLIDNNSTDHSTEIAKQLASSDPRIKLLTEPCQGVVFAANTGMAAAIGKYIARMDADDVAHPERLERQFNHLESNLSLSISATQVKYQSEKDTPDDFEHFVQWSNSLISWDNIYHNRFVEFPIVNPTLMFRKSILDEVGYLREGNFPEDYEWFLRTTSKNHKIEKLPLPLLDWHDSPHRLTRTDDRYDTDAFFNIKTKYLAQHLISINQEEVWIWGAGKLGFKRSQLLLQEGITIAGYIDIKKTKQLAHYPCVHFEQISLSDQPFILSYITNRGRRDEVRSFLNTKKYTEGENYIIAG